MQITVVNGLLGTQREVLTYKSRIVSRQGVMLFPIQCIALNPAGSLLYNRFDLLELEARLLSALIRIRPRPSIVLVSF